MSPRLVLGPMLRHVGATDATLWVETDAPCEVEVLGRRERTFCVEGHHYALLVLDGLAPGAEHPYEVALDGGRAWPPEGWTYPASRVRTLVADAPLRIAFGSCRVAAPHESPWCLRKDEHEHGRGTDALAALAERMRTQPSDHWPQLLLLLGDQVYADEVSPGAAAFIRARRAVRGPHGLEAADFEEYTHLYRESWGEPRVRWLLSTIASAMIFDDHDVHDDWNTSWAWRAEVTREPWWRERIVGAFMSYWLYQHLGNMSPAELRRDELYRRVREAGDAGELLREFALRADAEPAGVRWSCRRDLGAARLVVVDSRSSRVLDPGRREMLDEQEWAWLGEQLTGGVDHLLIASSLPILLGGSMHDLEAWDEAVSAGAWGRWAARLGERLRQGLDLEHWAAFERSFRRLAGMIEAVAAGRRGPAPETIVFLSGDVHHAYLAEVAFPPEAGARSATYQAVCSPFRNPLGGRERRAVRIALSRPAALAARALARAAGVRRPPFSWRLVAGPWFENQVATLTIESRAASLTLEIAPQADPRSPRLERVLERALTR